MPDLDSLPFTEKALEKARNYGHTAEMYGDVPPQSSGGKILVTQVEEIELARQEPVDDLAPIDAGDWNGYPNYGCPYCDMTSLDRNRVAQHAVAMHSRA